MQLPKFLLRQGAGCPLIAVAALVALVTDRTNAQDLLRRAAAPAAPVAATSTSSSSAASRAAAAQAAGASQNARDALRMTSQAIEAVQAMQAAARATAAAQGANNLGINPRTGLQLPNVPNGLGAGGLDLLTIKQGAQSPTQSTSGAGVNVAIKQTEQQALLHWKTFNVGRDTTVQFDQSAGGAEAGKWIAYNKIFDPSGNPTQILGAIKGEGQVYVLNPNGIIFGANSQVNARGLTASSLPLNDNLREAGLLNNPDAQFLFSGLSVPGGSDGTSTFDPFDSARAGEVPLPTTIDGRFGDVVVQAGAQITSPVSDDGNGGRVMLVGPNVTNEGTISTANGQTILAAGLQLGVRAHDSEDPSLRGLDVWVGSVGSYGGRVVHSGVIESPTGSVILSGKELQHLGVIESSTSVALNGRIDLVASYGAVANPGYDNSGTGAPSLPFLFQETGLVRLGSNSVTRILPDSDSPETVPGLALPEVSQINVNGLAIHLGAGAVMLAPNGKVNLAAGRWAYKDTDGNRTILDALGALEPGVEVYGANGLLFDQGQVYLEPGSLVSVAGSTEVPVALSQSILTVTLLGPELADSPLQRSGVLRGADVTVDLRETGTYNGRYWVGTPLADLTGFVNVIERNAAQLSVAGGSVQIQAGSSAVVQPRAVIDVSGGFSVHEGGTRQTTKLLAGGKLIDIADATPDRIYDGIFDGTGVQTSAKRWGSAQEFSLPAAPLGTTTEPGYLTGGMGGTLTISAPSMAVDGKLLGGTITGPRQRTASPQQSTLHLSFSGEELYHNPFSGRPEYIASSPVPPAIRFQSGAAPQVAADAFSFAGGVPASLRAERVSEVILAPELLQEQGFGILEVDNPDGTVAIPAGVSLVAPRFGAVRLTGANLTIGGQVSAPGGSLTFKALNLSPNAIAKLPPSSLAGAPGAAANRGMFRLEAGATLNAAGGLEDERPGDAEPFSQLLVTDGGRISITSFSADLAAGSLLDVSGGVALDAMSQVSYGDGGSISILTGKDPNLGTVRGGMLTLGAVLAGYSGSKGGSAAMQAGIIQVGGSSGGGTTLLLQPQFFQEGGFTHYQLTGIGSEDSGSGTYLPGVSIAPGTVIEPIAEQLFVEPAAGVSDPVVIQRLVAPLYRRQAASVGFTALGSDDPFTTGTLEVRGDIRMGAGSRVATDPGGKVTFVAGTVTILGSVIAPGGEIEITGADAFPLAPSVAALAASALPTVHLGSAAILSTAGTTVLRPDVYGRRSGTVYDGGAISLSGNILAEAGALLDVSGTSAWLDMDPATQGVVESLTSLAAAANSGLTAPLWVSQAIPVQVDSPGGTIELNGSELLYSDATLRGNRGGPSAVGGTLAVSSGRFYVDSAPRNGADINLVVTQGGRVLAPTNLAPGVGVSVLDATGAPVSGMGAFAVDRFLEGGFDSLDLGHNYDANSSPVPFGGNLRFEGSVSLTARGALRLAAGGVIQADGAVDLHAGYLQVGQPFRSPLNPEDVDYLFRRFPEVPSPEYRFAPAYGTGNLQLEGGLIDVGTLSLMNIGSASLNAGSGDIRGNGVLNIAGDLSLRAGQVYPTSLTSFDIFAYNHGGTNGSVTFAHSGTVSSTPLSAGGSLNVYAAEIRQGGVLRAPLGSIQLGWDGTGAMPLDRVAGGAATVPVTRQVTMQSGSLTSVSAVTATGVGLTIPFGLSPDGLSWVDPSGVNVTINGLPEKSVTLSGNAITSEAGATVDIQGGGDLYAYRWVRGTGGSVDLLGAPEAAWSAGAEYEAGHLVTYGGHTWSARVGHSGQTPSVSAYWTRLEDAFAVMPDYAASHAPYAANNTGSNSDSLGGDLGYVESQLQAGDRIYLEASPGLAAGYYTLLPRSYARLPGAFLVTPLQDGTGVGTQLDGASFVFGYRDNAFHPAQQAPAIRTRFEVAPQGVVANRVNYENHLASTFFPAAASRLALDTLQRLPVDAGALTVEANIGLGWEGGLQAGRPAGGRGSKVDLSSLADIHIIGGTGSAPGGATAVLRTEVLNGWGVESLLIGGLRGESGGTVTATTGNVVLNNPGASLNGPEVTLISKDDITLAPGSGLASLSSLAEASQPLAVEGDGTLVRVSGDTGSTITRTGVTGSNSPLLTLGAGTSISGNCVILDSSYANNFAATADVNATALALGSGQISVVFQDPGALAGSAVTPHLVLAGDLLAEAQLAQALTLQSYRTIDFYGAGSFGSPALNELNLLAGGIRGYGQGTGAAVVTAGKVLLGNPSATGSLGAPMGASGKLEVLANRVQFGANTVAVAGYADLNLTANGGVTGLTAGGFSTAGNLTLTAPLITGLRGSAYQISSAGVLALESSPGAAVVTPELGSSFLFTGSSITANTAVRLPSGQVTLTAVSGDVSVGNRGILDVGGYSQSFYDQIRYADAGRITLESKHGNVELRAGSTLSVSANPAGGDAGAVFVKVPNGQFTAGGTLTGTKGSGGEAGSFSLDAKSLTSYNALREALLAGGFAKSQQFRLRSGDLTLTGSTRASHLSFAADQGFIEVQGLLDASGLTGGSIVLTARDHIIVRNGSKLTAAAQEFDRAGKGGSIRLEAGAQSSGVVDDGGGVMANAARITLESGSTIDLSVAESASFLPGDFSTPGSAAFFGLFQGTLHLRAPRVGNDVGVDALSSTITGASSVLVEGYRLYDRTTGDGLAAAGVLNIALRDQIHTDAANWLTSARDTAIRGRLLTGVPNAAAVADALVVVPGVEIINRSGDLTLGLANNTAAGTTNVQALTAADWDLSTFRYGSESAPGVLTLRARGDLVFNNALSDGFTAVPVASTTGHSKLWTALPQAINSILPTNTQSWSYRLTAGADLAAADSRLVLSPAELDSGKGSVLVGEFYPAVPNTNSAGGAAAVGSSGLTANTIKISTTTADRGTRYEVIRTGTGSIDISAGRDVQLRNQFATIYTAGVAVPTPTTIFQANDFVAPIIPTLTARHPGNGNLGAIQQLVQARWTMAGGDVRIQAAKDAGRFTLLNGSVIEDSSRQLPNNWLFRRGYVDSSGNFASNAGVDGPTGPSTITDPAASTTWWVDFTNFFEGVGALGGGNVSISAGEDVVNLDAAIPTNARMPGRNPATGQTVAPDATKLVEWGGGDLDVRAEGDISGGVYYLERGQGHLFAGDDITTNQARSPSLGILGSTSASLDVVPSQSPAIFDSNTWLPTTLFVGRSQFEVAARGDVLMGPVTNTFLLPQGLNNQFWYKTYFNTFGGDAGADVTSFGGSVTHRLEVTLPGAGGSRPILDAWLSTQNLFAGASSSNNASHYQPWLRLSELDLATFGTMLSVGAPTLRSTAFAGDVTMVGSLNLFPSATGTLELLAAGSINGLAPTGRYAESGRSYTNWTAATVNLSDADPSLFPGVTSPLAYQTMAGRMAGVAKESKLDILGATSELVKETGSYTGDAAALETQRDLHAAGILHLGDPHPLRLYATGGDLAALTLFSPKSARMLAERDLTDVSFYIQNTDKLNISLVAAGRDLIPYNENAALRTAAGDISQGNRIGNAVRTTVSGSSTNAAAGDIQISGPGLLEVLAGRNLDLGAGANFSDGTGVGITSIGNSRNPSLPAEGADLLVAAGVKGTGGKGPARGLSGSTLDFGGFAAQYISPPAIAPVTLSESEYLKKAGLSASSFSSLTPEQQAVYSLEVFNELLVQAGKEAAGGGDYQTGFDAIGTLFHAVNGSGNLFARSRDIRTVKGGAVALLAPTGGVTMASDIFGNPLAPPGIVTESGGPVSIFTDDSVSIGQARIFTLRGGDLSIWSSTGDIAAGSAPRTVVTAPPTRVVIDSNSAAVQTDLGGLATGGGIGVLASVQGVQAGSVSLMAPAGVVDAGDAGIRATGDITIAAIAVINSANIAAGGASMGVPSAPSAPTANLGAVSAAASASGAANDAADGVTGQNQSAVTAAASTEMTASLITAEVIGYGGGEGESDTPPPSPAPESMPPEQESQPNPAAPKKEEDDEEQKKKQVASVPKRTPEIR